MSSHLVKGITLNDYFKLRDAEPFEDSAQLQCLIGDLITKPQGMQLLDDKIQEKEQKQEEQQQGTPNNSNNITQHLQEKRTSSIGASQKAYIKESKLSKLSSLELRTSSIKVYKSQKVRIRQVSNSPYERKLSKPKDDFKTLSGSSNLFSTHHYFAQNNGNPIETLRKYYRNAISPSPKQKQKSQKMVNLRHIKQLKQLQKIQDSNKVKLDGVYSTVNAYAKKIRDSQRAKHQL